MGQVDFMNCNSPAPLQCTGPPGLRAVQNAVRYMLLRLCLDVCLSANRKKLGGCFPLYSKDSFEHTLAGPFTRYKQY
jgi:hypothetical protein